MPGPDRGEDQLRDAQSRYLKAARHGSALGEPLVSTRQHPLHNARFSFSNHACSRYARDDPSNRRRRLEQALVAIKNSGNTTMIESLTAAIEGREANLNLPDLPQGLGKF